MNINNNNFVNTLPNGVQGYCDSCIIALYQRSQQFMAGPQPQQPINNLVFQFNNSLQNLNNFPPCRYNCLSRNANPLSVLNFFRLQQLERQQQQQYQQYSQQWQQSQQQQIAFGYNLNSNNYPMQMLNYPQQPQETQQQLQQYQFTQINNFQQVPVSINSCNLQPFLTNFLPQNAVQLAQTPPTSAAFQTTIKEKVDLENKILPQQNVIKLESSAEILPQANSFQRFLVKNQLPVLKIDEVKSTPSSEDQTQVKTGQQAASYLSSEVVQSQRAPLVLSTTSTAVSVTHKIKRKRDCVDAYSTNDIQRKKRHDERDQTPAKAEDDQSQTDQKNQKKRGTVERQNNSNSQLVCAQQRKKSIGWCMKSEQLLFEWNNIVLKQVSVRSDKIVNESVNVDSYVNILSKSRIMLISQDTRSLKYQINLIDLSREQVICKHQLGQNFQMHPFEPDKLRVQTVKISEKVSCIYLLGGQYFKLIDNRSLKNIKRVKQLCIQQVLPLYRGNQVVVLSLNGVICVYSTVNDKYNLIRELKISKNSQQAGISYVSYMDVDTSQSFLYCCVVSSKCEQIQIFNLVTGRLIQCEEIGILQSHNGYQISNMKLFRNHLYIELQLKQYQQSASRRMITDSSSRYSNSSNTPAQYKVQSYRIDSQLHLIEAKLYDHSNILTSSFSSQQFFLYDSRKSCIIGFEKPPLQNNIDHFHNSEHYLSHDPSFFTQNSLRNGDYNSKSNLNSQSNPSKNLTLPASTDDNPTNSNSLFLPRSSEGQVTDNYPMSSLVMPDQQIFKLNVKLTSPNHCPIFTHIFKDIPHEMHDETAVHHRQSSHISIKQTTVNFNQKPATLESQTIPEDTHEMVLTLFDQNKNVYKIYQN